MGPAYVAPTIAITVVGGAITNAYPKTLGLEIGVNSGCVFTPTGNGGALTFGLSNSVSNTVDSLDGNTFGVHTYASDYYEMGQLLYDNSGMSGNPLNSSSAPGPPARSR